MAGSFNVIMVSGTPRTLHSVLLRLSETIKNRQVQGYPLLQHDEEWLFIGQRDERECPICRRFEYTVHRGNYLPHRFPHLSPLEGAVVAAHVHFGCRCILELENPEETMRNRLHEELLKVM